MDYRKMYVEMGISKEVVDYSESVVKSLEERFKKIDEIAELNQLKVLAALQKAGISEAHLTGTNGYGHNDMGRDALEEAYAAYFHTEDALVRGQIICGTHALALALQANLRPGEEMLSPVGKPYDTLEEIIGIRESLGSLKEFGVKYRQVDLLPDGGFDWDGIRNAINEKTRLVEIQRSKGYSDRRSFSPKEIGEIIRFVKSIKPDLICMVDNCYGEFVCAEEPSDFGADMVVGSLIKNPGGGLALSGGYVCASKEIIDRIAYRLTCPGIGSECGLTFGQTRNVLQGIFLAPRTVNSAVKAAMLCAKVFEKLGFDVCPNSNVKRNDIIQAICLRDEDRVVAFCQGIQAAAPIDSHVVPLPWDMPGYEDKVVMAAGAFVQGSSIELSADAPIREPYNVYFQGGLTYEHAKFGVLKAADSMYKKGLLSL